MHAEKPPGRPSELDLLDPWVGEWEDIGKVRTPGSDKVGVMKGTSSASWKCDRQFLVEEMSYAVDAGARESAMAVRTWDPHAKLFRSWYFDNHGMVGQSKMTYDASSKTWHVRTESADPVTCEPLKGELTMTTVDERTVEWKYRESDAKGAKQRVEIKGTSRRN